MPRNAAWPYLDWPGPLAFAHRGGASEAAENTMPAFANAVDLGYRYLETDVHATRDGVVVAFHDDRLDRVTDRRGRISELPWSEVRQARVDGREPIPLLEDLLGAWPDVRVNIDPKHDAVVDPLADVLRRSGAIDRVCIGAFSDRRIARVRELVGPTLCVSTGPRQVAQLTAIAQGARRRASGLTAPCTQVPARAGRMPFVTSRFVEAAHRRGVQVHAWTVDDPVEMRRLLDLGVDGIMTDRPQVLKDVLVERGAWVS